MAKGPSLAIGAPLPGPFKSCLDRFEDAATRYPDSLAMIVCHQPADLYGIGSVPLDSEAYAKAPYLRWTYAKLRTGVDRVVRSWKDSGVQLGTPIFSFLPNGVEFILAFWASDILGCTVVPINIRNLANEREVEHMIETAFKGCPGSTSAMIITEGAETATKLDKFSALSNARRFICGGEDVQAWEPFHMLMKTSTEDGPFLQRSPHSKPLEQLNMIMFTSGTTSLPKGVKWEDPSLAYFLAARGESNLGHGDILASLAPNNHAMGCFMSASTLCGGATLLYPGGYFEPNQFLNFAREERCTHAVAVPTMIYALLLAKSTQAIKLEYLKTVVMGGAAVTPDVIRLCNEELGAKYVENGYGMTEGIYCFSGESELEAISRGDDVSIGRPLSGSRWKICAPDSREVLPRLQVGELHGSLPHTRDPYIGRTSEDSYRDDDGREWFATGDSAYIDEDDRLFIVGRFKEMIVRGGENISPAAIEAVVNEQAAFRSLQIQVVGVLDQIAGEVPVAVVAKSIDTETTKAIKDFVITRMGKTYSIDEVLALQDLGLTELPRTMAGKVQKLKLQELVRQHRQQEEASNGLDGSHSNTSELTEEILQIWSRIAGVRREDLGNSTGLEQLGDSITLMRVKDRIYKQTGISLTVQEILESRTMGNMINLAQSKAVHSTVPDNAHFLPADHPPAEEDLAFAVDDSDLFEASKLSVTDAIKPYELSWNDVRDVMPAYDFTEIATKNGTLERWSFKIALLFQNTDVQGARAAWKRAMANNPMQSSFMVWDDRLGDDLTLQVTVDQSDKFLDSLIEDRGTFKTVADLRKAAFDMVMFQGANYPGPLHRLYLYYIEEAKCAGAIWNMHHAVTDASFGQLVMEDVDLALSGAKLRPHVPYKLYCDNFYNLRGSPAARAAVKFHVQKFKDLGKHKPYVFPPVDRPLQIEEGKPDGTIRTWSASGVQNLIDRHKLAASLILKVATALFLLNETGYSHALLSQVEGARDTLPFMSKSVAEGSKLEASDVGGQLFQSVLNMISVQPGETTLDFLKRLQADAVLQTKHASAPWKDIMRGIGGEGGDLFPVLCTHCMFNWLGTDVSGGSTFKKIQMVDMPIRRDVTKFVNNSGWLRDKSGDKIQIHIRGSVWSIPELEGFAEQIEAATNWMTTEGNWNRPIEEFKEAMPAPVQSRSAK